MNALMRMLTDALKASGGVIAAGILFKLFEDSQFVRDFISFPR